MWETFKVEHHRIYETMEEETMRFNNFLENLKVADLRNEMERKNGGTATHGITKFSDLSQSEFAAKYLRADLSMKSPVAQRENVVSNLKPPSATAGLVDWTGIYTTPVKNQVRRNLILFPFLPEKDNLPFLCLFCFSGLLRRLLGLLRHRTDRV